MNHLYVYIYTCHFKNVSYTKVNSFPLYRLYTAVKFMSHFIFLRMNFIYNIKLILKKVLQNKRLSWEDVQQKYSATPI